MSQPWILRIERSGLQTHIATAEAASLSMLMKSSARLITPRTAHASAYSTTRRPRSKSDRSF